MSSGDRPFMSCPPESPLDLTVKRIDMDDPTSDIQNIHPYNYETYATFGNNANVTMSPEYGYEQFPHTSAPNNEYQYSSGYCGDITYNQGQMYPNTTIPVTNSSFIPQTGSYAPAMNCLQDQDSMDSYQSFGNQSNSPTNESSIIPKKRKNLWRPYDSKLVHGSDTEKESDEGSDSASGSNSDQEFKTPSPPSDPVKKRKTNRHHQNIPVSNPDDNPMKSGTLDNQENIALRNPVSEKDIVDGPMTSNWFKASERADQSTGDVISKSANVFNATGIQMSTDSRDKLISGMKKRDIFGWSLKLKTQTPPEDGLVERETDASQIGEQRVCTDGDKTYTELQTVKKSSPVQSPVPIANDASKQIRSQPELAVPSQEITDQHTNTSKDNVVIEPNINDTDNDEGGNNYVGKKVYIQRRDNIIECCNETESNITNKTETRKKLSLIDLIEEIEATALLEKQRDELEKANQRNKRNRSVTKLLDQCNYVKLQALDYLMANVLIQDKQHHFKAKNEKVQRMLKGDKINSVNMLDVVELQVEMGLN